MLVFSQYVADLWVDKEEKNFKIDKFKTKFKVFRIIMVFYEKESVITRWVEDIIFKI